MRETERVMYANSEWTIFAIHADDTVSLKSENALVHGIDQALLTKIALTEEN